MPPRPLPLIVLALLSGLSACDSADGFGRAPKPAAVPDRIDRFGSLELVTHTRHYRLANSDGWGETQHWSLRRDGQPFVFETRGGMFNDQPMPAEQVNAVFVLGEGDRRELIVNVGDPNNSSAFHALRPSADAIETPLLCTCSGGDNTVAWLDGPDAARGASGGYAGPQYRELRGGRFLMLGSRCLYDSRERQARSVPYAPSDYSVWTSVAVLGLAPDGLSLVRFGSRRDEDGNELPQLLVADLQRGDWQALPVDRERMRYAHHEQLDPAWLAHHFEWRSEQGRDRLHQRSGFAPLPWRGYYLSGVAEYRLDYINAGHAEQLGEFLQQRFGAERLPDNIGAYPALRYALEGQQVTVTDRGFFIAASGQPYYPGEPGDPAVQRKMIETIGAAFDQALASGDYDAWFADDP